MRGEVLLLRGVLRLLRFRAPAVADFDFTGFQISDAFPVYWAFLWNIPRAGRGCGRRAFFIFPSGAAFRFPISSEARVAFLFMRVRAGAPVYGLPCEMRRALQKNSVDFSLRSKRIFLPHLAFRIAHIVLLSLPHERGRNRRFGVFLPQFAPPAFAPVFLRACPHTGSARLKKTARASSKKTCAAALGATTF